MATLFLAQDGIRLKREGEQLVAKLHEDEAARIPLEWLDLVVLQGACHVTQPALVACLAHGVSITWLSRSGDFLGRLEPPTAKNAALQRAQLRFSETPAHCLQLARQLVHAKLRNAATVLRRREADTETALNRLALAADAALVAPDVDTLRGHEGAGAAAYFQTLVQQLDPALGFTGRHYRPTPDPVNAAFNFVYSLLRVRFTGAIAAVGLNPYLGVYHADRQGHAALVSDLMEEWRPAVADRLVLEAIDEGLLRLDQANVGTNGDYLLGHDVRRSLLTMWERRLEERVTLPGAEAPTPLRVAFLHQVQHVARHMTDPVAEPYSAWRVR